MYFCFYLSILDFCSFLFNYYVGERNVKFSRNKIGIIYDIIILYILIGLFIYYCRKLDDTKYSIYNVFWYYLVYYILFGLLNILLKKYFIVYFYSIYLILLLIINFVCVSMFIYDIIAYCVKKICKWYNNRFY